MKAFYCQWDTRPGLAG